MPVVSGDCPGKAKGHRMIQVDSTTPERPVITRILCKEFLHFFPPGGCAVLYILVIAAAKRFAACGRGILLTYSWY